MHALFLRVKSVSYLSQMSIFHRCPERSLTPRNKLGPTGIKIHLSHNANAILGSRRNPPCPTFLTIRTFRMHIPSLGKDSLVLNDSCAGVR